MTDDWLAVGKLVCKEAEYFTVGTLLGKQPRVVRHRMVLRLVLFQRSAQRLSQEMV